MRRSQYRAIIAILTILNVALVFVCAFLIIRIIELEDSTHDVSNNTVVAAESIPTEEVPVDEMVTSIQADSSTVDSNVSYADLIGTWIDGNNTITILDDGSYMWVRLYDQGIDRCEMGYLTDANSMIITRKYDVVISSNGSVSDESYKYFDPSEIPDSEWVTEKESGYSIVQTSSETFGMRNVRGEMLGYSFIRE